MNFRLSQPTLQAGNEADHKRELPGCFFPKDAERTYNRSFEYFAGLVKNGKIYKSIPLGNTGLPITRYLPVKAVRDHAISWLITGRNAAVSFH